MKLLLTELKAGGIDYQVISEKKVQVSSEPDAESARINGVQAFTDPVYNSVPTRIRITKQGFLKGRTFKEGEEFSPHLEWIDAGHGIYQTVLWFVQRDDGGW